MTRDSFTGTMNASLSSRSDDGDNLDKETQALLQRLDDLENRLSSTQQDLQDSQASQEFLIKELDETKREVKKRPSHVSKRGKLVRNVKAHDISKVEELERTLPEDTYSFFLTSRLWSFPFFMGVTVFVVQVVIFILVVNNIIDWEEKGNILGIPANVDPEVRLAQLIALAFTVVVQMDLVKAANLIRPGIKQAFPETPTWRIVACIAALFIAALFGILVSFILIVESDNVFDLLLNFTAVGFVSELDECIFFISRHGFLGKKCEDAVEEVKDVMFVVKRNTHRIRRIIILFLTFLGLLAGWSVVTINQIQGRYQCKSIFVQMGDDTLPALGTFSGQYDLEKPSSFKIFQSSHVTYVERRSQTAVFGYCKGMKAWTFHWNQIEAVNRTDIDFCNNWRARSSETDSYDITKSSDLDWFTHDSYDRLVLLDPFALVCQDCDSSQSGEDRCHGRGTCNQDTATCECSEGWYGPNCEFPTPCDSLVMDARTEGFLGSRQYSDSFQLLGSSFANGLAGQNQTEDLHIVSLYNRPVYYNDDGDGNIDLLFFTGRRWVLSTISYLLGLRNTSAIAEAVGNNCKERNTTCFHGHWSNYSVAFVSEPVDIWTPKDSSSPIGLQFYAPAIKTDPFQIQAADKQRASGARLFCEVCSNATNPCFYDGVCAASGKCECSGFDPGALCEVPPTGDGRCDTYFNQPSFDYDGGDCCETSCVDQENYACGLNREQETWLGFPSCRIRADEWTAYDGSWLPQDNIDLGRHWGLPDHTMSSDGKLLVVDTRTVEESAYEKHRIFRKAGKTWQSNWEEIASSSSLGMEVDPHGQKENHTGFLILTVSALSPNQQMNWDSTSLIVFSAFRTYQNGTNANDYQLVLCSDTCELYGERHEGRVIGISRDGSIITANRPNESTMQFYSLNTNHMVMWKGLELGQDAVLAPKLVDGGPVDFALTANRVMFYHYELEDRIEVWKWDYWSKLLGDIAVENPGAERKIAMSDDGQVLGIMDSSTNKTSMYQWNEGGGEWKAMGKPLEWPYFRAPCTPKIQVSGKTVAFLAYDTGKLSIFDWDGAGWVDVGKTIIMPAHQGVYSFSLGASGSSLALSIFDRSATGRSYLMKAFHRNVKNSCRSGGPLQLVNSVQHHIPGTVYQYWAISDVKSRKIVAWQYPYHDKELADWARLANADMLTQSTFSDQFCMENESCYAVAVFPVYEDRYDIFLDGVYIAGGVNESRTEAFRTVYAGDCACSVGNRTRIALQANYKSNLMGWSLVDTSSEEPTHMFSKTVVFDYSNYDWEDPCLDLSRCYTIHIKAEQGTALNASGAYFYLAGEGGYINNTAPLWSSDDNDTDSVSFRMGTCE